MIQLSSTRLALAALLAVAALQPRLAAAQMPTPTPAVAVCPPTPVIGCESAEKSTLKLLDNTDPAKTKLLWKWTKGIAEPSDFGNPVSGTANFALCIYDDGALKLTPAVGEGGTCNGKPCWRTAGSTGLVYSNRDGSADGITGVRMVAPASRGKAHIIVKAKGAAMPFPLAHASALTVQLIKNRGAGQECFESVFPAPAKQHTASRFLAQVPPDPIATPIGGSRPVNVYVPPSYLPWVPAPLVIMLHGYSVNGGTEEFYLGLTAESDLRGFLYVYPTGTIDSGGRPFWNATDACCNFDHSPIDDSAYISSIIAGVEEQYNVDRKRIYIVGHSNGAFMAHRLACDHANQIAAIVSLAGAQWDDVTRCDPSKAVSILQIHGSADNTIKYNGGSIGTNVYPSAATTIADWVGLNGCNPTPDLSSPPLDLDSSLAGDETTVERFGGCDNGSGVELWTINGGAHIPTLSDSFTPSLVDFLYAHPRP